MTKDIPIKNCLICGKESGTKIVCDECYPALTKAQIIRLDGIYQRIVIELYDNQCVDCGLSAETESGELCAAHLEGKNANPLNRYDLAGSLCKCFRCHEGEHRGNRPKVPKGKKLPKQTQEKVAKIKKPAVCSAARCPIWALPGSKHCWKHQ